MAAIFFVISGFCVVSEAATLNATEKVGFFTTSPGGRQPSGGGSGCIFRC